MTRKVRLEIDRLILDGVDPGDRAAFERALKAQLAAALRATAGGGGLSGARSSGAVDGGRLAKPADPAALAGRIVARLGGSGS